MSEDSNKPKIKKKKKNIFKIIKIFFVSLFCLIILAGVAGLGVALAMIKTAPNLDKSVVTNFEQPSVIYDNQGNFMDKVVTGKDRTIIPLNKIPDKLKDAFISIEDERFYEHKGIDPKRILGVVYIDIKNKITHNENLQGASTITQQLLKKTLLTDKQTLTRKVQEMYLAVNLEKQMSKDDILEAYLNLIPLGGPAYGVEAAANQYFSKSVKDLSLLECAFIAGVTQSPSSYYASAYSFATGKTAKNVTPRFVNRTIMVLDKMLENNKISKSERDAAVNDLKNGKLVFKFSQKSADKLNFEWFSLPVINSVKQDLIKKYNLSEEEVDNQLMNGGLKIYSTMDRNLQNSAQKIINDPKSYNGKKGTPDTNGIIQPQSAAVIMDYHTGEVKCIIGGRGDQPPKSYNRAAYNGSSVYNKPVGSSIKPLTVYSPAIDTKKATAGTVMENSPLSPELQKLYGNGGLYNPKNDDNRYTGYEPMRYALAFSHNLPAVKFADLVGVSTSKAYAEKYGLPSDQIVGIAASALGELPNGTNAITMAAAYGVFGNNGMYTASRLYTKVVDMSGKTLLEGPTQDSHQVISPQAAYIMWDLLHGPVKVPGGTAYGISIGGMPIGGKTGTSSDQKNLWFCGLSPYLSGAVWIGNDKPAALSGIHSSTAARLWAAIMKEASKGQTIKDIKQPSGLVRVAICKDSGKLPTDNCKNDPRGSRVYSELFIQGTQPTSLCDIHVSVKINKDNNKLATEFTPIDKVIDKVFITRSYIPKVTLADQKYVVPTAYDDTKATVPAAVTVTGVSLNETDVKLKVGNPLSLTAIISPQDASNQNVTWISDNPSVATVDTAGNVTVLTPGNATITVTTEDGGYTATCKISVK
ncbi:MAG: PBP1A family penicillin-binding protein [Bacillota bacterium]|nr:PBP1A family penicillin-binding protein [Bacillota bacterium]